MRCREIWRPSNKAGDETAAAIDQRPGGWDCLFEPQAESLESNHAQEIRRL
jgi:hypothetical protein